ncbi:MAG: exodeoxyribonuclease VII large subunit [Gemmatimonadaceae bacterium]|nr:exodeoxyribonuclease VII large subunit [Gemmatimonadaceae bacterium]
MSEDGGIDSFGGDEGNAAEVISDPPVGPKVWSITQVNRAVKEMLESSIDALWIGGEIGQWTRSRPGHCYFTLKDEQAELRAVMFARDASLLPTDPEQGMKVRCFGDLTLYERRGNYQMIVRRIEAEGEDGLWRKAFEKLKGRLAGEGLLADERKLPLPAYPEVIGVVTSPTGAALRDIMTVLRRRAPWSRIVLSPSRVQGEGASEELAKALDRLVESEVPDVIIVGRGGGSLEDLWAFNEEALARAIVASPIPIVSAVGHEVDVTISDLVADVRAPTPSAAAELVVPDGVVLLSDVRAAHLRLSRGVRRTAERRRARVTDRMRVLSRMMERSILPARQSVGMDSERLERSIQQSLDQKRATFSMLSGRLEALSPLATLARGYSVARTSDGTVLRRVTDFHPGLQFDLKVTDGTVEAKAVGPVKPGREER